MTGGVQGPVEEDAVPIALTLMADALPPPLSLSWALSRSSLSSRCCSCPRPWGSRVGSVPSAVCPCRRIEDCLPPLEDSPSKRFSPSKRKQYYINKAIRNSDLIPRAKGRKSLQRLENSKDLSADSSRAGSLPQGGWPLPLNPLLRGKWGGAGGAGPL